MTDTITLKQAVGIILEGFTLPDAARKILETAYFAEDILAQQAEQGWQPIETAPKDFVTSFDGWCGERVADITWAHPDYSAKGHYAFCISEYEQGFGHVTEVKGLTHWIPLPVAPKVLK